LCILLVRCSSSIFGGTQKNFRHLDGLGLCFKFSFRAGFETFFSRSSMMTLPPLFKRKSFPPSFFLDFLWEDFRLWRILRPAGAVVGLLLPLVAGGGLYSSRKILQDMLMPYCDFEMNGLGPVRAKNQLFRFCRRDASSLPPLWKEWCLVH